MSSRVRLLPAVIGAVCVLMMLRLGALASSSEPAAASAEAEPAAPEVAEAALKTSETHAAEPSPEAAPAEKEEAATQPSAPSAAQAQTKGEAEVLQNLSARRAALEARERDVAMREQLMAATEKRVSERLAVLKDLEGKLGVLLTQRDSAEEAQMTSLVKSYENMKPSDAAKIFNKLDRSVLLSVASRMKPAKIGSVMAAMEPQRAQELTVLLATRMNVAKTLPAPTAQLATPAAVPTAVPVAPSEVVQPTPPADAPAT